MDKIKIYSLFFILSIVFVLLYSTSTSPLYTVNSIFIDQGVYETIGYNWLDGAIPYKDLFDQKGPLIYAINAFGFWLTGNRYGISFIIVACLFVSLAYCYKLLKVEFTSKTSILLTIFCLFGLILVYDAGNMVEEYLLPFLFASFYNAYLWFKRYSVDGITKIEAKIPVLFGLVLGISFLTRLTNALGVCIVALFMIGVLLYNKKYKELGICAIQYFIGVAVITLPFVIYFYSKDALKDLWYCVITFNVKYAVVPVKPSATLTHYMLGFSTSWILSIIALCLLIKDKSSRLFSSLMLTLGLVTSVYFFKGRGYLHYAIIALPYIALYLNSFKASSPRLGHVAVRAFKIAFFLLCITYILGAYDLSYYVRKKCLLFHSKQELCDKDGIFQDYLKTIALIPKSEYSQMIELNCKTYQYLYIKSCPAYKFFILQDFQTSFDKDLNDELNATFEKGNAKWIIYNNLEPMTKTLAIMQEIIQKRYVLVNRNKNYSLYKLP